MVTIDATATHVETTIALPCFRPQVCILWKIKIILLEVIKTVIGSVELEQISQLNRNGVKHTTCSKGVKVHTKVDHIKVVFRIPRSKTLYHYNRH